MKTAEFAAALWMFLSNRYKWHHGKNYVSCSLKNLLFIKMLGVSYLVHD